MTGSGSPGRSQRRISNAVSSTRPASRSIAGRVEFRPTGSTSWRCCARSSPSTEASVTSVRSSVCLRSRRRMRAVRTASVSVSSASAPATSTGSRDFSSLRAFGECAEAPLTKSTSRPLQPQKVNRCLTAFGANWSGSTPPLSRSRTKFGSEKERDAADAQEPAVERKRQMLISLQGIGGAGAAILAREVFARTLGNRRQLGSYLGLTPSAYDSGSTTRCRGIIKAGNSWAFF